MIQNGILLSSFPFGRITSCIMGVTVLNQDTKTTELLCGTCCQKKPSKNQNIIKATGTGEGPLTRFCMLSLLNPMGVFPYFLLVTEVTMSKSNSSSISWHFFFFYYQQTVWKPHQQKSNLFWRSPLGRLESQDSTINHTETCVLFTLAFAVSNIVSTIRTSEPPSKSPLACSA